MKHLHDDQAVQKAARKPRGCELNRCSQGFSAVYNAVSSANVYALALPSLRCAPWSPTPPPPLSSFIRAVSATANRGGNAAALGHSTPELVARTCRRRGFACCLSNKTMPRRRCPTETGSHASCPPSTYHPSQIMPLRPASLSTLSAATSKNLGTHGAPRLGPSPP